MTARVSSAAWDSRLRWPSSRNLPDGRGVGRAGVDPDPAGDFSQLDTGASLVVAGAQGVECLSDLGLRALDAGGQRGGRHRRVEHEQDRLQGRRQLGGVERRGRRVEEALVVRLERLVDSGFGHLAHS